MTERKIKWAHVRYHWEIYLFVLPALLFIALFQYYPAASGIFHSFYRWNGADISEPVGLGNYLDLLNSAEFWDSFKVALLLGAFNALKMAPAVLVAACIHRCRSPRMQYLYRIFFVVPMVIPPLVIALIWRSFFFEASSGFLNQALHATGLYNLLRLLDHAFGWGGIFDPGHAPAWLGDPRLIVPACIIWGFPWVGSFAVLTHLAKLQGIGSEIYEAAEIDGANWWSKFTRIEMPVLMNSVHLLLVFVIIDTIKDAGTIFALAGIEGGPGGKATVPALFMLRKAFLDQQMGYACCVGIVLTAVVFSLQKLGAALLNWRDLSPWRKTALRCALIAFALLLVFRGTLLPLAAAIILASFPYGVLPWRRFARARQPAARAAASERPWRPPASNPESPLRRTLDRLESFLLRSSKHGAICAVLALALLPLYLMFVVSLKDNQQFYDNPVVPSGPYHWENWRTAWEMITPTLANSFFISTMTTLIALLFAICAAYFFVRLRMPLSGVFWNAILILMMLPAVANLVPLFTLLRDLSLLNTLTALILVGVSAGQVFAIFVLRNFVEDIPASLFEAAEIDGASHFQQMWTIVVPLSGPILGTVGVMQFLTAWNEFLLPLIVVRDRIRLPVMVQLLRMAGEYIKLWGPLMAGYTLASLPVVFLFVCAMKLFIRGLTEGANKG